MVKTDFATELNRKHFLKLLGAFFAGIDNELNLSVYCEKSLVQFLFISIQRKIIWKKLGIDRKRLCLRAFRGAEAFFLPLYVTKSLPHSAERKNLFQTS